MKKITLKELLDERTELGRARRKQLAANFEEMLRRARKADLAWMDRDEEKQNESIPEKSKAQILSISHIYES